MADWRSYLSGKRVWVTGASSGIGEALVRHLGDAGIRTVASARRLDRLQTLSAQYESVSAHALDLAQRESLPNAVAAVWDQLDGVDVLINNAGISQRATFLESDPEALYRVIDIDLLSTMRLTQLVAARMARAGTGHLVAISSVVARIPSPLRTAYAAAKQGLHGLYDALRGELEPQGIAISIAVPGAVRTEISTHAVTATGAEHGLMDANQASGDTPERCAERILKGIAQRKREFLVSMTPKLWAGVILRKVAPGILWRSLSKVAVT